MLSSTEGNYMSINITVQKSAFLITKSSFSLLKDQIYFRKAEVNN